MVFEKLIRYRQVEPAQAGFAFHSPRLQSPGYKVDSGIMTSLQKAVNHEGHKGTRRKCASCLFTFVRFVSFVFKPVCSGLNNYSNSVSRRADKRIAE